MSGMIRQYELAERVKAYNPAANEDLLHRAYLFGLMAHASQRRASGEPYFNHPVEVAAILTQFRVDDQTIATALLHDTIEDTEATYDDLVRRFGKQIADMVDGVTKLSKLAPAPAPEQTPVSRVRDQAENWRKLVMAMAKDPRVLLVKLADRLHNMRCIAPLRADKQQRIARETLEIFAPLAGRMGMQAVCEELEDLCFAVLDPKRRASIIDKTSFVMGRLGESSVDEIVAMLRRQLFEHDDAVEITGRAKRPYSIWRKMEQKGVDFEKLSDVLAFRIVVPTVADCYRVLGAVHGHYPAVIGRFKDYISSPKTNGYRSLHSTVVGPDGQHIELQIRTHDMDEMAEIGVAAHWAYKNGVRVANRYAGDAFRWLRDYAKRVEISADEAERRDEAEYQAFIDEAKCEMKSDKIFCFTPKGELKGLQEGATALDFAYAIHSDVGYAAASAKIDGAVQPLHTVLRSGQTVEIIQERGRRPTPRSLEMATTGRARHAIRKELKAQSEANAVGLGEGRMQRLFERNGAPYSRKSAETAAARLGFEDVERLFIAASTDASVASRAFNAVYPEWTQPRAEESAVVGVPDRDKVHPVKARGDGAAGTGAIAEDGVLRLPTAPCCRPLPGERIVAILEADGVMRLHRMDCAALVAFEDDLEAWLDVGWASEAAEKAENLAALELLIANKPGVLGAMCSLIGEYGANIDDLAFLDRKPDFFRLKVDLEVRDAKHLQALITALQAKEAVAEAVRRVGDGVQPITQRSPRDGAAS